MAQLSNRVLFNRYIYFLFKDSKRYAGHSKWANIKHIKAEKDGEKQLLFRRLTMQMQIAIREGGSTKPNQNLKLSQLIEQAKKANMPSATIKNFLEKMEANKNKNHKGIIEVRGPGGYIMLISYLTHNPKAFAINVYSKLKKTRGKVTDGSAKWMFIHTGNVIVEKKNDLEQAIEDAINVDAKDVEEFKENDKEYFRFKCDPKFVNNMKTRLESYQYHVISAEETYIPKTVIELDESDKEAVSNIHKAISSLEDISDIYDNLA